MAYRINHIHLKASDPRRTAEWYVGAFGFKIVNDCSLPLTGQRVVHRIITDLQPHGARKW